MLGEEEVVRQATEHADLTHGHEGTTELREHMSGMLEPVAAYAPGTPPQKPMH